MIRTRKALQSDFPATYCLYKQLVGHIPVPSGAEGERHWEELLGHPGTSVLLAEKEGKVVAMVTVHVLPNMTFSGRPYALIENVVTDENHQGQGIGKLLMQAAMDLTWNADAYKIMLLSGKQFANKGFYEKLGFSADQKIGMICRRAPQRKPSISRSGRC